ncbi:MAG: TRAP transporter large permease subunit [Gammaproteobacteria bacterium]|nr:TRAP transporter large permease subunit [Gammaproteobacteria bacterium]
MVGTLMFLLVMEISRIAHPALFWVNCVLIVYTLWGYLSPVDFFWHPGTSLERVITSSTVELATGIYGRYAQLALTLIAAFLLLAAAARGFDAQSSVIQVMRRIAGRSRHTIPQTAVLASVSVGMVSGSGSANTAVTGSFTIPLMKRYGIPGAFAGAVETAASMGGLIMPPLMAVAGFLMAEFLGVPYWDVVVRGAAVAAVYFTSLIPGGVPAERAAAVAGGGRGAEGAAVRPGQGGRVLLRRRAAGGAHGLVRLRCAARRAVHVDRPVRGAHGHLPDLQVRRP